MSPDAGKRRDAGAVAIGRNEGAHLRTCLESLASQLEGLVYVDSGSTDGSVGVAAGLGVHVLALDPSLPFTAARARNEGFERLCALHPELRYVQFVDGDCAIDPGWLAAAAGHLDAHTDVAIVCGRLREAHPELSPYNRLCDMEWNEPAGDTGACGGIFAARAEAFRGAGGLDPSLAAGEEPELCYRLRRAGWRVVRLDAPMARHDAALTRFGPWWSRMIRSGYAYAEGMARHGREPERYNVRESLRIWLWGLALPLLSLGAAAPSRGGSLLLLLAYPALALRIASGRVQLGDPWRHALLYGAFLTLGRWAQLAGQLRYWLRRDRARQAMRAP